MPIEKNQSLTSKLILFFHLSFFNFIGFILQSQDTLYFFIKSQNHQTTLNYIAQMILCEKKDVFLINSLFMFSNKGGRLKGA